METKGIKLGIHQTQAKPKKTFAITKNGNVDVFQPQVQNCYKSFLSVEALWASNKMFIAP
jgi:hypothetical protein